jgi:hypothetical protein
VQHATLAAAHVQIYSYWGTASLAAAVEATLWAWHVLDQQSRISRQREVIAQLERDGHLDLVAEARRMEQMLASMEEHCHCGPGAVGAGHNRSAKIKRDTRL